MHEVTTRCGRLSGLTEDNGTLGLLGIRYGVAPRLRRPEAAKLWTGVFDATRYGPNAPQAEGASLAGAAQPEQSEDCLVLNVWTPAIDAARRPVMVWLHGGGFVSGSGSSPWYHGARLARRGDCVVVTTNHRLGALGYSYLDDPERNNVGLYDIIASLAWVRDNIDSFGGDPENVTIFGESGGGRKVATLMAMPDANGLFHKAIIESGPSIFVNDPGPMTELTSALGNVEAMAVDEVIAVQQRVLPEFQNRDGMTQTFAPVVDGVTLPHHPFHPPPQISSGVSLMIGFNQTEATLFMGAHDPDLKEFSDAGLSARCEDWFGPHAGLFEQTYRELYPDADNAELLALIATGRLRYNVDTLELALRRASQAADTFLYMLEWRRPGRLRTPHALEIPLVFDNVANGRDFVGPGEEPQHMADLMSESWIAFARSGSPQHAGLPRWPRHDQDNRPAMVFNLQPRVENEFRSAEHALWRRFFYADADRWVAPASIPHLP